MKISKMWKRFWSLDRHHAQGFTLVELIVVIAILAILAGVAIPVYSGYVTKANKQADISLASEVAQALELAYYQGNLTSACSVALCLDEDVACDSDEASAALTMAFGDGWNTLRLKHDGWNGNDAYKDSSYAGKETEMTGRVEGLTEALADFLVLNKDNDVLGGRFGNYMETELGFDSSQMENEALVADAAVLYVANTTKNLAPDKLAAFANIGATCDHPTKVMEELVNNVYSGSLFLGTAATYAIMTGYCATYDIPVEPVDGSTIGEEATNEEMLTMLGNSFAAMFEDPDFDTKWAAYMKNQVGGDVSAFVDVMGTVNDAKGQITNKLGTEGCYTSTELRTLLAQYANGNIIVIAQILPDGSLDVQTLAE